MPRIDAALPRSMHAPPLVYALNFSMWKRAFVRRCIPGSRIVFVSRLSQVPAGGCLLLWGMSETAAAMPQGVRVFRVEDGFLRSVGLGADLVRPLSWVIDTRGIYYDATRWSDLEVLLETGAFDAALLGRARFIQKRIVESGLTKYNIGDQHWQPPKTAQRLILVPGQVESDASLTYGLPVVRSNMALLRAVREAHPQAHIIYKPHPDVVARLRAPGAGEQSALQWCDEIVVNVPMNRLLDEVHEVHVMTSLTGFEALLRGKAVTCYGQPFYAGWGLTTDIVQPTRRSRRLTLDELVAGTLIKYPLYLDRHSDGLIAPESALDQLEAWCVKCGNTTPWWQNLFRVALRGVVGVR